MKYLDSRQLKILLTALLMFLAGVTYSCSRLNGKGSFSGRAENGVLLLSEDAAVGEAGAQEPALPEPSAESSGALQETGESPYTCFVHICGAVARPGVYELPEGSRICQAVEAAGGFLPEAEESALNLAALLEDGMMVRIFTKEEAASIPSAGEQLHAGIFPGTDPVNQKVNINTAGKEELMTLKGIGESRAEAIIAFRQEHGPFQAVEDIMQVPGIKAGAFEKIREDIVV